VDGLSNSEHYMLYIQWESKIDADFIRMAAYFSKFEISLIPVKPDELDYFLVKRQVPVIVTTKSMKYWMKFQKVKETCFDFYMSSGKIRLFHLNSFREISDYLLYKQKGNYINLSLPLSLKEVAKAVLEKYLTLENDKRWPGGRRSRLPTMGGD
jgi:hypothetical protein